MKTKEQNRKIYEMLLVQIPNISEFYNENDITRLLNDSETDFNEFVKDAAEYFMDIVFDSPIRRCSICGKLFHFGYYLGDSYACSDECRNEYYKQEPYNCQTDVEAEREYYWERLDMEFDEEMTKEKWNELPISECKNYRNEISENVYYSEWL